MNILVIGAHPDDVDLGCGGAIQYHRQRGDRVFVLVVSNGGRTADPELRRLEQVESGRILGMQVIQFLELNSLEIADQPTMLDVVRGYLQQWDIDMVYVHSPHDTHDDHVHVTRAVVPAARLVKNVLFYETPSTIDFHPTVCVSMEQGVLQTKLKAIRQHQSQVARHACDLDLLHWVRVTSQFRGMQFRTPLAEGFVSHRFSFLL